MSKTPMGAGALLSPVPPVLVTCGTSEKPNVLTVAWTGIINTKPPMLYISVRPERYSYNLIKNSREFTVNLATEELCRAVDFCGVKSGSKIDKFAETGLTLLHAVKISAPIIEQCPLSLECRVTEIKHLGSHDMFIAEIVEIQADEDILDKNGKLDFSKARLLAYAHGEYFALGKKLGSFGYSVRKKPASHKRRKK